MTRLQRWIGIAAVAVLAFAPEAAAAQSSPSVFSFLNTDGRSIEVGGEAAGSLSMGDALAGGGRRVQAWVLDGLLPGDQVIVDLMSDDFDAFLYMVGPGLGEGIRDDDGGNGLDSRICFAAEEQGEYRIIASSLGGNTGAFDLRVTEDVSGTCASVGDLSEVTEYSELPWDDRLIGIEDVLDAELDDSYSIYGTPVAAWGLQGQAGLTVTIDLISGEFDPVLTVLGPGLDELGVYDDDSGGRCNSRLEITFSSNAMYTLVAETLNDLGDYTLAVRTDPPPPVPGSCYGYDEEYSSVPSGGRVPFEGSGMGLGVFSAIAVEGSVPATGIVNGSPTGSEGRVGDRPFQAWEFEVAAGERVSVGVEADFDTYMYLIGPNFPDATYNDDFDGLNSRICYEADQSGTMTAYAGPYSEEAFVPGESFVLTVRRGEDADAYCGQAYMVSPAASENLAAEQLAMMVVAGELPFEGDVRGAFDGTETQPAGTWYESQAWALIGSEGENVAITLRSEEFDPYLFFMGPGFLEPLSNDDGAGSLDSRICVNIPETGEYRVLASALGSPSPGEGFTLSVARGSDAEGLCGSDFSMSPEARMRMLEELMESVVAAGELPSQGEIVGAFNGTEIDPANLGREVQPWTLSASTGERIAITLRSESFDPYLFVTGPGLTETLSNDDGAEGVNSRICLSPPASGQYQVLASAFGEITAGEVFQITVDRGEAALVLCEGQFDLTPAEMEIAAAAQAASFMGLDTSGRTLVIGEPEAGYLDESQTLANGDFVQAWSIEAAPGTRIFVDQVSNEMDTYLRVVSPSMGVESNDDFGDGLNSRVVFNMPEEGRVTVVAGSLSGAVYGAYTLSASRSAEEAAAAAAAAVRSVASTNSQSYDDLPDDPELVYASALPLGTEYRGVVTGEETQMLDGRSLVAVEIQVPEGAAVVFEVGSEDFDTYMYLQGPGVDGTLSDDDSGEGLNSRISLARAAGGTYTVFMRPLSTGSYGGYSIRAFQVLQ